MELLIPQALSEKMDRALLTAEDAWATIAACETSGNLLRDNLSGALVGHAVRDAVTFWVRYTVDSGVYTLERLYTHRARLEETHE